MEQDVKKLLHMLDRMNKFAATFMVVAVDNGVTVDILEDYRLAPFKGAGAESMMLHGELSAKYSGCDNNHKTEGTE